MGAPLSFFTSTDVGTTTNRYCAQRPQLYMKFVLKKTCRFSQDMTVIDAELPYALVDLSLSIVTAIMGAILMCLSAGYFAATMPPVILIVFCMFTKTKSFNFPTNMMRLSTSKILFTHIAANAFARSRGEVPSVLTFYRGR